MKLEDITVVIPTKNRANFLLKTIPIFLNEKLEVIIIDDCSNKEEKEKLENLNINNKNFKIYFNENPMGAPFSRNLGLKKSKTNYIWFFDDDDTLTKNTLNELKQIKLKNERIIILSSLTYNVNTYKKKITDLKKEKNNYNYYRSYGQQVNTSCYIFQKSLLEDKGKWDEKLVAGQDTDLILNLSKNEEIKIINLKNPVIIHEGHLDRITINWKKQQLGKIQFLKKNWKILTNIRRLYYIVSLIFMFPLIKKIKLEVINR